jgi:hypothetical protein
MRKDKVFEETCEWAVNNQKPTRNLMVEEGHRPRSRYMKQCEKV